MHFVPFFPYYLTSNRRFPVASYVLRCPLILACYNPKVNSHMIQPLPQVNLSPLPRSVSYPSNLNSLAVRSDSALNAETIPTPSLVNSIQQSWGLTKKRVYAAQQIREPFVSDERVNEQQNSAAPSLSLVPTSTSTSPTRDPRRTDMDSGRRACRRPRPCPQSQSRRSRHPSRSFVLCNTSRSHDTI